MAVFLDIQGVQSAAHGERGIARYLTEVSLALERWHPDSVARYLLDPQLAVPGSIEPLGRHPQADIHRPDRRERGDGLPRRLAVRVHRSRADLAALRPPDGDAARGDPLRPDPGALPGDLPREPRGERLVPDTPRARSPGRPGARDLEATARDAIEQLGLPEERVVVVGAGVSERFHPPASRDAALSTLQDRIRRSRTGYVLYTGGIEPRKNIDRLLEAYAGPAGELRARHQLVIVCRVQPVSGALLDAQLRRLGVTARFRSRASCPTRTSCASTRPRSLRLPGPLRGLRSSDRRGNGVWRAGDRSAQLVADRARPGRRGAVRATRDRVDPRSPRAGAHRRRPPRAPALAQARRAAHVAGRRRTYGGDVRGADREGPPSRPRQAEDRSDLATAAAALRHRPLHVPHARPAARALRHRRFRRNGSRRGRGAAEGVRRSRLDVRGQGARPRRLRHRGFLPGEQRVPR